MVKRHSQEEYEALASGRLIERRVRVRIAIPKDAVRVEEGVWEFEAPATTADLRAVFEALGESPLTTKQRGKVERAIERTLDREFIQRLAKETMRVLY